MASSLISSRLYRVAGRIVAFTAVLALLFQIVLAQRPNRAAPDKGPRAMGLLEFGPNGKAHLIPITIMIDGKFYDAGAYKASPVPMALESGTVYEAVRSGLSQGLFSVTGALEGQATWLGQGTWESEAEIKSAAARKKAREAAKPAKKNDDPQDGPPVLRRAAAHQSDPDGTGSGKPASGKATTTPASAPSTSPAVGPASSTGNSAPAAPPTPVASQLPSPSSTSDEDDPDRPHLGRGKPAAPKIAKEKAQASPVPAKPAHFSAPAPEPYSEGQMFPAISDAGGPEPRPYAFEMKPDEESQFRTKMLAIAAVEVAERAKPLSASTAAASPSPATTRKSKLPKSPEPVFEDVHLRVFDLSNSNEPVLILTAKAHMPLSKSADEPPVNYFITLVALEDIYADLHKALSNITDNQHLDVSPRLDLIDAVDIDGDGRGELLFRQVYDRGGAYVVYRVIGNQLWPLFQGAIG